MRGESGAIPKTSNPGGNVKAAFETPRHAGPDPATGAGAPHGWGERATRWRGGLGGLLRRRRQTLLLLAAIALGSVAAFGARGYISEQIAIERERLAPNQPMVSIVVAKQDLARGEVVSL